MNFLYPQFLFGFLALAIPIIVHLFNFRKTKKIQFSNNLFLKYIKEVSTSKRKLKHYLILASRLLFIAFLVLAFAQPIIPGLNDAEKNDVVYLYVDNSNSMSNNMDNDLSALDQSLSFVEDLLEIYPQNTRFKFLTNDFQPGSDILKTKDEIREEVAETGFSSVKRTFSEVNSRLMKSSIRENSNRGKDVYILSDFQRSTIGAFEEIDFDSAGSYYLVPLPYRNPGNVYIDTLFLTNPFLLENEENELMISFRNASPSPANDISVRLFINENQVANTTLSIEANSSIDQSFELNQSLQRINTGRISFEEFPVTFDNDFYFTLNVDDRVDILEIRSQDASDHIANVYANQSLFNFSSFPIENLDYNLIANTDLIVLNELVSMSPSLVEALLDFLNDHGTITIIPAAMAEVESFSPLLNISKKPVVSVDNKMELRTPDLSNPFFASMFIDNDEAFQMPLGINIFNTLSPNNPLLTLRNREPFLSELVGDKNIFLFSSSFHDSFTNFHQHAVFVPVMYRIASLSNVLSDDLYYSIDQSMLSLRVDTVVKNAIFKLANQDQELIPAQRIVGRDVVMELPKDVLKPGYYDVLNNEERFKILSFNYDDQESILNQYSAEELEQTFENNPNVTVYEGDQSSEYTSSLKELHSGVPLWKYMLIVALIALLAEILIIRYL